MSVVVGEAPNEARYSTASGFPSGLPPRTDLVLAGAMEAHPGHVVACVSTQGVRRFAADMALLTRERERCQRWVRRLWP